MNMPVERVREILKISQEPVSLETPIGEEEDSHLGDFIQDDNVPVPADAAAFTLLKEQLEEVLGTLTEREQKVLTLRFALRMDAQEHSKKLEENLMSPVNVFVRLRRMHCVSCVIQAEAAS